ncbi:hypothetical protein CKAH01_06894 [Colletotrichum kahawae]|uniref:2EXR domain-containing protein n=1 Tax=Colletotrichum kahawae TaxID=34407 RepID=A0AAD9Y8D6_COLKA|nr:hypothetical protein CKAH01_06894 [Colletotrichum kahawae]
MTSTFTLFPNLPPELRWEIWGLAIGDPPLRSAHFFSVQEERDPSNASRRKVFAAPSTFTPATHRDSPWLHGSPSAYAADYGLWSACKESRRAIANFFSNLSPSYPKDVYGKETIGVRNVRVDGVDVPFATFPCRDLVCLQVPRDLYVDTIQAVQNLGYTGNYHTCVFHEGIAFEYDDSWAFGTQTIPEMMEMPGPRSLFLRLVAARCNLGIPPGRWGPWRSPKIFLIERGAILKPSENCEENFDKFSGNGFRLVAQSHYQHIQMQSVRERRTSAWAFINLVRQWMWWMWNIDRGSNLVVGHVLVAQLA